MLTEQQIDALRHYIVPLLPKNKRGFSSKHDPVIILQCIVHKLKTGCQWRHLFIELEGFTAPFSWELVYYYYRRWLKAGVFEKAFAIISADKKDDLLSNSLYLDGTRTISKKRGSQVEYQHRKRAHTTNILTLTNGKSILLVFSDAIAGNHNDRYKVVPTLRKMLLCLHAAGMVPTQRILIADAGFDAKGLRRLLSRFGVRALIKENPRNRQCPRRERKKYFDDTLTNHTMCYVNERSFEWPDSSRTVLIPFDTSTES